ncbi:MAG: DNA polymerase III subunit beta [Patescibacteria group bacterium]
MNITVGQNNLRRALNITERVVSRNTTLPILQNVILKTEQGRLRITATNLELAVTVTIGAKIEEVGEIAIPGKILTELMNALTGDTVTLITKQETLAITTDGQDTKVLGSSTKEYPIIPKISDGNIVIVSATALKRSLSVAMESAAVTDSRPELAGVFMRWEKGKIICAATDGFRLVEQIIPAVVKESLSIIIPRSTAAEIVRIVNDGDETITIKINENQMSVSGDNYELISRLVDGKYPEYHRLIPDKGQARVLVSCQELEKNIKLAGLFSSSISDITVSCEQETLTVVSQNSDRGEAKATVPAVLKGDSFSLSVNYKYLLDGLRAANSDKVILEFTSTTGPLVVRPAGDEKSIVYLLMPLRK